jgi:hypothetical protein
MYKSESSIDCILAKLVLRIQESDKQRVIRAVESNESQNQRKKARANNQMLDPNNKVAPDRAKDTEKILEKWFSRAKNRKNWWRDINENAIC